MQQFENITLLDKLFMEVFPPTEILVLEISIPESKSYETGVGIDQELDAIGRRLQQCIATAQIPGIKKTIVTRSKDAEIVLELQHYISPTVTINRQRGNTYRDRIGEIFKKCDHLFKQIKVEGATNINNRINTAHGPRYIDIKMVDVISGKPVNIELKRGQSRYHSLQKQKDALIHKTGKGQTYIIRGTPKRKGR